LSRNSEYYEITKDILNHDAFMQSKDIRHHEGSIFEHSLEVSFRSYKIAKKLKMDYRAIARGALLHDFFLYDWRTKGNRNLKYLKESHAVSHPRVALENARKYFDVSDMEADIIKKHMFPTTIVPPKYKESWIVTMVDKYYAVKEYQEGFFRKHSLQLRFYQLQQTLSFLTV